MPFSKFGNESSGTVELSFEPRHSSKADFSSFFKALSGGKDAILLSGETKLSETTLAGFSIITDILSTS